MHFTRLRLHGFKSFVEPTDLDIPPGLTGIVGPNGCGKSNLVEALRWVMGENSAKRMRGSEMDDVIFGGTATRPSRNVAEVMLELDNAHRTATAEFNNDDTIQVTRQIERGNGSDYKVNGKPVRQRDVQLLFADQATGAHSTNLVGQGQIDALIRAKPQDRRQILEEASGTSGLHARRHEAELKLKGAEQNLTRVDDVLKAYDTQLRSLKTQVRQASRYRNLAEHIRKADAALLHLRWLEAEQNAEATKQAQSAAELRSNELLGIVTQGNTARANAAAELPDLRQIEAAAAAVVQKLTIAREHIEAESKRIANETAAQEGRLAQAKSDHEREHARRADGETAIAKLDEEQKQLAETLAGVAAQMPNIDEGVQSINQAVEELDAALTNLMQEVANTEARRTTLSKESETLNSRMSSLTSRRDQMDMQRTAVAAEAAARPDLAFASAMVEASETELAKRQSQAQSAEQSYRQAEQLQTQTRDLTQQVHSRVTKLKAEAEAISTMLVQDDDQADKVIDLITVAPGLEQALAVALGEALTAALDPKAAMYWRAMEPMANAPALPAGITPISQHIKAPAALERSLSQVGLVFDQTTGENVAPQLQPGQIIVSRDGWAWRWDGFTVTPQAKTATAMRLQQRNRLTALQEQIIEAEADAEKANFALNEANNFFTQQQAEDRQCRDALKAAFAALNDARETYARQEKETTALTTKLAALDDSLKQVNDDLEQVKAQSAAIETERSALPDTEAQQAEIIEMRTRLAEQRGQQAQKKSERDRLHREQSMCEARSSAIVEEIAAWNARLGNASQQIDELATRISTLEAQLVELHARPAEIEAQRSQLLTELTDAEAVRKEAADRLIAAEHNLASIERQLKQDEESLSQAREERVRAEGAVLAAQEHFTTLRERMVEKLNCGPEELVAIAAFVEGEPMPDPAELEQALARYVRERDNMGPVNLRAETEAETMQGEIDKLTKEKDDLEGAIAKLRQGISALNKEARERLNAAFGLVNERFQKLFTGLFGGGKAHLALIDNEDPMEAGLEIFASPPGKKMQILSLLSGGERTLTALALLFAVFQTNPSPICVLDEAEAALDESNIGRFCNLVEEIAKETGTRFLIITHQRLTMAKMNRLYGVTMSEKGVSQLVSVDLEGAIAVRDGEKPDAVSKPEPSALEQGALEHAASKLEDALEDVRAA